MRRFLKNISIFIGPVIVLFGALFIYINISAKNNFEQFRFSPSINILAVGDSHIQETINDSLVSNIKNVAYSSETFIYSFYKIMTLTKNNPNIDTILLGVSYHSFTDYFDEITYLHYVLGRYFCILPIEAQIKLISEVENPASFIFKSILNESKNLITRSEKNSWLGWYENYATSVTISEKSIKDRIRTQYYLNKKVRGFSDANIYYFNSIVNYCREKNIVLIILNTPMHSSYKEKVPRKFIEKFYSLMKDNNVELIEFDELPLTNDNYLPDGDHVNGSGAILATKYLEEVLKLKQKRKNVIYY
jgi:hypothetical protein